MNTKAILSSPIISEGMWDCKELFSKIQFKDVPHYIGHPATKELIELHGAVPAQSKFFDLSSLKEGENYLAISLRPEFNTGKQENGITKDVQKIEWHMLSIKIITKLK